MEDRVNCCVMPIVKLSDVRLYVERRGRPDGVPVVLVNGMLTDLRSWDRIEPLIGEQYPTVLYDRRGQGQSDKPDQPYTSQLHARDLVSLVDELGLESMHLVGLSSGGVAALLAAARLGPRVKSLVVSGVYSHMDVSLHMKLDSWLQAMTIGGLDLRFLVSIPWVWSMGYLESHENELDKWRTAASDQEILASANLLRGAMEYVDIRGVIQGLQSPVLLAVGAEDILTPPHYAREIATLVAHGEIVTMAGAGHAAALEKPDEFAKLAVQFMALHE